MIIVDSRETNSRIPELLGNLDLPFVIQTLEVGDYLIGNVAIERKEISDYVLSLTSGRLNNQLYNLSFNFELSYLVIVGHISEALIHSNISRSAYISSLVGSSYKQAPDGKQGVIVTVNLDTKYDFVLFLKYLHDKVSRDEPRLPKITRYEFGDNENAILLLSCLPNVGEVKARRLLEHFGAIRNVVNATLEELMEVEGIGEIIAKNIYKLLNSHYRS